jgi:uncharacterized protein YbaR (Trm112 family)
MRLTLKLCPICKRRLYYNYHEQLYVCTQCDRSFEIEEVTNG